MQQRRLAVLRRGTAFTTSTAMFPRRKARRAANNDCPAKAGHGVPYRYNFNTDGNGWSSEDRRYEIKCRINCPEAM